MLISRLRAAVSRIFGKDEMETRAWFQDHCELGDPNCPAADGGHYVDADGVTRCRRCGMKF